MNPAYRPMLATLVDGPFDDKAWVFETKWDGFRLITEKSGNRVKLWSRNGIDVTQNTPSSYRHFKRSIVRAS
jgi:ATP-dependent DNA ligase